jgi:tripartite-type tricarboxylate transporter receptor subunit TctC
VTSWYSLVAPAATPPERVARLQQAIAKAFARPEVRDKIAGLGAEPVADTPAEFAALLRTESERWRTLAREANIHAD